MTLMQTSNSNLRNLFAVSAPLLVLEQVLQTVVNMEPTILSSNASFAALSLNGSAGEIHISVNHVTKNRWMETMFLENLKQNFQNVQDQQDAL